ncbi:MAG: hypothetical protein M3P93_04965 [Actinomycetota bacterium]|nr:hypothetical protein [Actinomycetota bacterium]
MNALLEVLTDPLTARQYARAAHREYQQSGTDRQMAEQTAAVYDQLLATAGTSLAGATAHSSGSGPSQRR